MSLVGLALQVLPRVPLVSGGSARVQPLFVQDLARAIYTIASVRLFFSVLLNVFAFVLFCKFGFVASLVCVCCHGMIASVAHVSEGVVYCSAV